MLEFTRIYSFFCQWCRHSVVTCPFKQSNLSASSLLSWHPAHTYLWGRLCFVQVCCLLSTIGHAESWLGLYRSASLKQFQLKSAQRRRVRFFAFIHWCACACGSLGLYFDSKVDLRLRIVTVPEVYEGARRNGVETEKNRDKSSNCEHIELPAKLLDHFLRINKSNINQSV